MGEHLMWYLWVCFILIQCDTRISAILTHEVEGKTCETPSGERGVCRQLPECLEVLRAITQGDRQHTRCGFLDSVEIVCCKMESATHQNTFSTTKFQSSSLPPRRRVEIEYSTSRPYMNFPYENSEALPRTTAIFSEQNEIFSTVTEASVWKNSDEDNDDVSNLNNIETDIESIDSRIFLSNTNGKRLSPLFPLNALKNIVTGILVKPTLAPKTSFTTPIQKTTKPFHNSESYTKNYYFQPTTQDPPTTIYNINNEPISELNPTYITSSITIPLQPTSKTTILDYHSNEVQVVSEAKSTTEKNENPSLIWWETYASPVPKPDMTDTGPPYYFPFNPSSSPEITPAKSEISTSSWLDIHESSPPSFVMDGGRPPDFTLPNTENSSDVTTTGKTSTVGYGSSWEGKPIDESILNVQSKPTRTSVDNTWIININNPTTEKTDSHTENPNTLEFWYPSTRPAPETLPTQNRPSEDGVRPEDGVGLEPEISSEPEKSSKNITDSSILRKSQRACDKYKQIPVLTKYIIGGDYAAYGEFPHMVALGFQKPRQSNLSWLCGGTLLNEEFVLTAAHCVKTRYGAPVAVRVGFTNLTADWSTGLEVAVSEAISHPSYNPIARAHDIALLRIASPLSFSQFVLPACLRAVAAPPPGPLVVTGWGSVTPDGATPTDLMKKALVTTVEDAACKDSYPNVFRREMICAGSEDAVDTCKGDSGGPMQLQEPNSSIYTVVGITSFGPNPCAGSRPGVYTRVASYLTWIEGIVW